MAPNNGRYPEKVHNSQSNQGLLRRKEATIIM
jgi:hypothetical protein